MLKTMPA